MPGGIVSGVLGGPDGVIPPETLDSINVNSGPGVNDWSTGQWSQYSTSSLTAVTITFSTYNTIGNVPDVVTAVKTLGNGPSVVSATSIGNITGRSFTADFPDTLGEDVTNSRYKLLVHFTNGQLVDTSNISVLFVWRSTVQFDSLTPDTGAHGVQTAIVVAGDAFREGGRGIVSAIFKKVSAPTTTVAVTVSLPFDESFTVTTGAGGFTEVTTWELYVTFQQIGTVQSGLIFTAT